MSDPNTPPELTDDERLIIDALNEAGPLDAIGLSSRTRLPVTRILELIEALKEKSAVSAVDPEPVHQRIEPVPA